MKKITQVATGVHLKIGKKTSGTTTKNFRMTIHQNQICVCPLTTSLKSGLKTILKTMKPKRFDPTQITTSRILSGDDTPQAVRLQAQTKTHRTNIGVKSLAGHSGGARIAGGQTIRSRSR